MPADLDWNAIYRECAPSLRRFIRTRVPDIFVEDTLQDTFVRAYRSRDRFDPSRPSLPWLLAIARRACFETLRVLPPETPSDALGAGSSGPDELHELFESRLRRESIATALSGLSPRHRRLLLAWEIDRDVEYSTLATAEGVSTKALKSALCRARSAFRTRYAELAERVGVAAAMGWSPTRLRTRIHQAGAWVAGASWAEATVGGIAVVLISAAVAVVPPATPSSATLMRDVVPAASTVGPSSAPKLSPRAPRPPASEPGLAAIGRTEPVDQVRRSEATAVPSAAGIAARSSTDFGVDDRASTASITLGVQATTAGFTYDRETEFRCDTPVRRVVCDLGRETSVAR